MSETEPFYVRGKPIGDGFKKSAHELLIHIYSLTQRSKGVCVATTNYLSKLVNKSPRQIYYYLSYLKTFGYINVETSKAKRNKDPSYHRLFYKNRFIQTYCKEPPEGTEEVNNIHFSDKPKKQKRNEISNIIKGITKQPVLQKRLLNKKGVPLPPEKVGKVTEEYFNLRLHYLGKYPNASDAEIAKKMKTVPENYSFDFGDIVKEVKPENIEVKPISGAVAFYMKQFEDFEPEEGHELEKTIKGMNDKDEDARAKFYKRIFSDDPWEEEVEETVEPLMVKEIHLNLVNPWKPPPEEDDD